MKWGYGLTIFGVLGLIATITTKESMTLQNILMSLFFLILGIILIIKNTKKNDYKNSNNKNKKKNDINNKNNDINIKHINDIISTVNIIFPIHIKYRKIEIKDYKDEKLNFYRDMWYNPTIANQNQPTYNCILDNKIIATLSCGQESDIDVQIGEHIIFFETANNLLRDKIKDK